MTDLFDNSSSIWFLIGFSLLAIEAFVLGLSSGLMLFGGLAALITGSLFVFGVLEGPALGIAPLATTGIGAAVLAVLLWQPLKSLQKRKGAMHQENSSDLVGLTFILQQQLSEQQTTMHSYSGIDWKVELDPSVDRSLPEGTRVRVIRARVGAFTVVPAD